MKKFIMKKMGFIRIEYTIRIPTLYIYDHKDHYEKIKVAGYVRKQLGQCENEYFAGGFLFGLFLAPKTKLCYTIDRNGTLGGKMLFKGFLDTK